jgi:toxin FitB
VKYLLDTMLLKEIDKSEPHRNVEAWLATVDDLDLAISVINVREIWKGIERKRAGDPGPSCSEG